MDKHLIKLSSDITLDYVLPVLSALQGLEQDTEDRVAGHNSYKHNTKIENKLVIDLKVPCEEFAFIFKENLTKLRYVSTALIEDDYSFVKHLSLKDALDVASKHTRPLAQAFGILLGCDCNSLPDLSKTYGEVIYNGKDMYLTYDSDIYWIMNSLSHENFYYITVEEKTIQERISLVLGAKAVFGYPSFDTYLACALKKPVVEIETPSYLYKWSNPNYVTIRNFSEEALVRATKRCLSLMAQEKSNAQVAAEQSPASEMMPALDQPSVLSANLEEMA